MVRQPAFGDTIMLSTKENIYSNRINFKKTIYCTLVIEKHDFVIRQVKFVLKFLRLF